MEAKTISKTKAIVETFSAVMHVIPRCVGVWGLGVWCALTLSRFEKIGLHALESYIWVVVTFLLICNVGLALRRDFLAQREQSRAAAPIP